MTSHQPARTAVVADLTDAAWGYAASRGWTDSDSPAGRRARVTARAALEDLMVHADAVSHVHFDAAADRGVVGRIVRRRVRLALDELSLCAELAELSLAAELLADRRPVEPTTDQQARPT